MDKSSLKTFMPLFDDGISKYMAKKLEITQVVVNVMGEKGIEGTSFESVGRELKMTKANVAYYYDDKEEMIRFAIQFIGLYAKDVVLKVISKRKSDQSLLNAYISGNFHWALEYPKHLSVMLLFFYYTSVNKDYKKLYGEFRAQGKKGIADILQSDYPSLKESSIHVDMIQNIITGALIETLTTGMSKAGALKLKKNTIDACKRYLKASF